MRSRWSTELVLLKDWIAKNLAFSERPVDREFKSHQPHIIMKWTAKPIINTLFFIPDAPD